MKHRDPASISGALAYACTRLEETQTEGKEIVGKACGKSAAMVSQWIDNESIHMKHATIVDRLCLEAFGETPMRNAMQAMTGRVAVKVSFRNMGIRIASLAGRLAGHCLDFAVTRCLRTRDSIQTTAGKLVFKLHKLQAGIAR